MTDAAQGELGHRTDAVLIALRKIIRAVSL